MLLLIDNYDSFSHNLTRYFVELGQSVRVVRNDQISLSQVDAIGPEYIVISPGPCSPNEAGISLALVEQFAAKIPMLGVCLGHQVLGQVFGASVTGAKEIMHGKTSKIVHAGHPLFTQIPSPFIATRYHSLVLDEDTIPSCFEVTAWCYTSDGQREVMAMSHAELNLHGVQFHPESLLTEKGHQLLKNFLDSAK